MAFFGFGKTRDQKQFEDYLAQLRQANSANMSTEAGLAGQMGTALGGYQSILAQAAGRLSGMNGYNPQEATNMRVGATAPVAGAFGSMSDDIARRAAITGNPVGLSSLRSKLARDKGMAIGQAASGVEGKIADARREDQRYATEGTFDLARAATVPITAYGNASAGVRSGINTATPLAQMQQHQANQPGMWDKLAVTGAGFAGDLLNKRPIRETISGVFGRLAGGR